MFLISRLSLARLPLYWADSIGGLIGGQAPQYMQALNWNAGAINDADLVPGTCSCCGASSASGVNVVSEPSKRGGESVSLLCLSNPSCSVHDLAAARQRYKSSGSATAERASSLVFILPRRDKMPPVSVKCNVWRKNVYFAVCRPLPYATGVNTMFKGEGLQQ